MNNYFLTVPPNDIMLQNDDAVLARTPGNLRRSNSSFSMTGELFGRKFSTHRRSVENLQQSTSAKNIAVADINYEIRSQLETAKEEISSLQYEFEKKFQKESMRLGLQAQKPLFNANEMQDNQQLFARLEVFESEVTQTLQALLKAYSSLQNESVKIQRRLT